MNHLEVDTSTFERIMMNAVNNDRHKHTLRTRTQSCLHPRRKLPRIVGGGLTASAEGEPITGIWCWGCPGSRANPLVRGSEGRRLPKTKAFLVFRSANEARIFLFSVIL